MKKKYLSPAVEKVNLDNQIALVMMSPIGDPSPIAPEFSAPATPSDVSIEMLDVDIDFDMDSPSAVVE